MITSLTIAPADEARILNALGLRYGYTEVDGFTPRPATDLEYKSWLVSMTDQMVIETEGAEAAQDAKEAVPPLGPIT